MLRVTASCSRDFIASEPIGINGIFSQIIRWKRKPIWLPPCKSKLFKVPPRLRPPREEAVEFLRLYNNYRTYNKSVRQYLMDLVQASQVQFDEAVLMKSEEEDFLRCVKINEEWNNEIAKVREIRLEAEQKELREIALKRMEEKEEYKRNIMREIEEKVRKVKREAPTFITRENIDQAIEESLANVVNHNIAIDKAGNHFKDESSSDKAEVQVSQ